MARRPSWLDDVRAVRERDPAAGGTLEVFLCYPGLHAVWAHRIAHALWRLGARLPARFLAYLIRAWTGIDIHPAAVLGPGVFIDHGMGVVIGETAEVGADVILYQGVTLGGTSLAKGKRHPTLGDRVVVGAGAKILGAITVGDGARIGANAVVVRPVPPDAVVVGVPGRAVRERPHAKPDLEHGRVPDLVGDALGGLLARIETLERDAGITPPAQPEGGAAEEAFRSGGDFVI